MDLATILTDDLSHTTYQRIGFVDQPKTVCGQPVATVLAYDIAKLDPTCPTCLAARRKSEAYIDAEVADARPNVVLPGQRKHDRS